MLSGPQTSRTPAAPARAPPRPGELLHLLVSHSAAWTRRYTRERLRELRAALGWQLRTAGSGDVSGDLRFLFRLRTLSPAECCGTGPVAVRCGCCALGAGRSPLEVRAVCGRGEVRLRDTDGRVHTPSPLSLSDSVVARAG